MQDKTAGDRREKSIVCDPCSWSRWRGRTVANETLGPATPEWNVHVVLPIHRTESRNLIPAAEKYNLVACDYIPCHSRPPTLLPERPKNLPHHRGTSDTSWWPLPSGFVPTQHLLQRRRIRQMETRGRKSHACVLGRASSFMPLWSPIVKLPKEKAATDSPATLPA